LPKSIPLHAQGLNYKANVYELKDHVGERDWVRISQQNLSLQKKIFMQVFLVAYSKAFEPNPRFSIDVLPSS
jgi:hypothetical protein